MLGQDDTRKRNGNGPEGAVTGARGSARRFAACLLAAGLILAGCGSSDRNEVPQITGWEKIETPASAAAGTAAGQQGQASAQQAQGQAQQAGTQAPSQAAAAGQAQAGGAQADPAAVSGAQGQAAGFSFADLKNVQFVFSSGAGGWDTTLEIRKDGSFEGVFHDSEMGDVSDEAPNGSIYYSSFEGFFTEPVRVNDYTYSTSIGGLNYENTPGTEEIQDGIRYVYSEAYGLDDAGPFLIYLPDAPVKELPGEFTEWVRMAMNYEDRELLGFYGLYNENAAEGFSGFRQEITADVLRTRLQMAEQEAADLAAVLGSDVPQLELNFASEDLYEVWDRLLNDIWDYLKETLEPGAMKKLTDEQVRWISEKEAAVKEAGAPYEGGSIQPLIMNKKAAELTEKRVRQLMEYVK